MKLLTKILLWIFLWHVVMTETVTAGEARTQLESTRWNYQKIFLASEVPPPPSVTKYNGYVKAIYSPSVVKVDQKYYMFFGVSVYCRNDTIARDSIAAAESTDGLTWKFLKYVIEPEPSICATGLDRDDVVTIQANDPSAYFDPKDPETILVFYTTVKSSRDNYGHIGLAKFDTLLNQKSREDLFLSGTNTLTDGGYSRPSLYLFDPNGPRMYFDSKGAKIGSVPLLNTTKLDSSQLKDEEYTGIDIHTPNLSKSELVLLSGGIWGNARDKSTKVWGTKWRMTAPSGQGWDVHGHGSPELFIDDGCKVRMYIAGVILNQALTNYTSINLGVAVPKDDKSFDFEGCRIMNDQPKPVLSYPINNQTVPVGKEIELKWTLPATNSLGAQRICVSSNQSSCDLMWKQVGATDRSVKLTIGNTDDLITWSVTTENIFGKKATTGGVFKSSTITDSPTPVNKIMGDANGDRKVDLNDFAVWKKEYVGQALTNIADFNNDTRVNLEDFVIWKRAYLNI